MVVDCESAKRINEVNIEGEWGVRGLVAARQRGVKHAPWPTRALCRTEVEVARGIPSLATLLRSGAPTSPSGGRSSLASTCDAGRKCQSSALGVP